MKLTPRQYAEALHEVTHGKDAKETSEILAGFLARLRREKGMKKLPAIVRALGRLEEESSGIMHVDAVVGRDWKNEKRFIKQAAETIFDTEKVEVDVRMNPESLGGLLLRTENHVWDATVRTKLTHLKRKLTKE